MISTGNVASLSCDSFPKEQITSIRIICCFNNERIYSLVSLIYMFCLKKIQNKNTLPGEFCLDSVLRFLTNI